ncbi:hypothetical protein IP88_01100, partial [alpha proteobacterium AAP81b]
SRGGLAIRAGGARLAGVAAGPTAGLDPLVAPRLTPVADGQALVIRSDGAIVTGDVRGDFDVWLDAVTGVNAGQVSAGDSLAVTAGGAIVTAGLDAGTVRGAQNAVGQIGVEGASIATGAMAARGNVGLFASGNLGAGSIATGGSVAALAGGDVALAGVTTGATGTLIVANAALASRLGDVDPLGTAAGYSFAPLLEGSVQRVGGAIAVTGAIGTGRLVAAAGGNIALAAVTAATDITLDSGAVLRLGGAVASPTLAATARDIDIAAAVDIAGRASLTVGTGAGAVSLGTLASPTGFTLDAAEFARLAAAETVITAPGTRDAAPTITIGTLNLAGSAAGRTYTVTGGGTLRVTDAVTAASGVTRLGLTGDRIEVVTDAGGRIALVDAAGAGPRLDLAARNLWVGDAALLTALAADADFAGRDAALNAAPATPALDGALQAGTIAIRAAATLLVQNSGDAATRAGFSAGTGGLSVTTTGQAPLDLVINGRLIGGAGVTIVNNEVREALTLTAGDAGFAAGASVNGCLLSADNCGVAVPDDSGDRIINIGVNLVDLGGRGPGGGPGGGPPSNEGGPPRPGQPQGPDPVREAAEKLPEPRLTRLVDLQAIDIDEEINEPVSAAGNPAMWQDTPPPPPVGGASPAPGTQP